jgi:hypothetical protein
MTYELDGKTYLRIGPDGTDDLEYLEQIDGSIYLPELDIYYSTIE